jgi:hypothetical protein
VSFDRSTLTFHPELNMWGLLVPMTTCLCGGQRSPLVYDVTKRRRLTISFVDLQASLRELTRQILLVNMRNGQLDKEWAKPEVLR